MGASTNVVPADKFDLAAVARADHLDRSDLMAVYPDLLEWLKDGNWPVALPVAKILAKAGSAGLPFIEDAFRSSDDDWIYFIRLLLIPRIDPEQQATLRHLIED